MEYGKNEKMKASWGTHTTEKLSQVSDVLGPGPKPEGPTGCLARPKEPEPDIPGPRPEICINALENYSSKNVACLMFGVK